MKIYESIYFLLYSCMRYQKGLRTNNFCQMLNSTASSPPSSQPTTTTNTNSKQATNANTVVKAACFQHLTHLSLFKTYFQYKKQVGKFFEQLACYLYHS